MQIIGHPGLCVIRDVFARRTVAARTFRNGCASQPDPIIDASSLLFEVAGCTTQPALNICSLCDFLGG